MTTRIRLATPEDCDVLGVVAPAAYAAAFGYLWDDATACATVLETYNSAAFRKLLAREDAVVFAALIGDRIVGYRSAFVGSRDPVERQPNGAEIARIYLPPGARRLGLGRVLADDATRAAQAAGCDNVWLDVMDSAPHARRA